MKQPLHHRRIRTSNLKGWTSNTLNELSELFVQECAQAPVTALDIGSAHGVATIPALAAGATLIANDSSAEHLDRLRQLTPPEFQDRLQLLPGRFPRDTKLQAESLDLAHASNVFHFLTGRQLEQAAAFLEHAIRPGGKIFILAATPYMKTFEPFIPTYESRLARNDPWPGWITNVRDYSTHRLLSNLPKAIHLLDEEVLKRVFESNGFVTQQCWYFRRRDLPKSIALDGRENVAYIARKI